MLNFMNNIKSQESKKMVKFNFLIGTWNMEYNIPKSSFHPGATGMATGTFKRALDDKYVIFDYVSLIDGEKGSAHGIFVWDEKAGFYAPSIKGQSRVIQNVLDITRIDPGTISYVEAHGTGTALGDPIEVGALAAAMAADRGAPLLIGSVKSNLGHLEAAAGVAGLMKAALSLHHKRISASLHFQTPNPYIPWGDIPLEVVTEARTFPANNGRLVAGVSSFGFTGTNVHMVLEAPPGQHADQHPAIRSGRAEESIPRLLKISARSQRALADAGNALAVHFQGFVP